MEQRLSKLPDLGYEDEPVEHVKIAITCFAFRNAVLIRLLRERGLIIKQEKWDKIEVIDKKINDLKNNHLEDLTTPCSAFMTFECEEGYNRATRIDEAIVTDPTLKPLTIWLDDYTLDIKQACEPTDIIWENRHFTALQRFKKEVMAICCLIGMLSISFALIFFCSQYNARIVQKYPVVDCATITGSEPSALVQEQAILEYSTNNALE
jgi:hypothetical protein